MRAHFFTPFLFVVLLSSLALAEEPPPATPTNTAQPPGVDGAAGAPLAQAAPGAERHGGGLEARLALLKAERARHGIAGPIALTGAGVGVAAVSGLLAWFSVHRANRIQHNIENPNEIDCTICPVEDPDKERAWRHRARVFEVASFVGLGAAAAGATWLVFRLRKRNAHREEIRELQLRRRALTSIRLGAGADMGGLTLSLSGRF